MNNNGFDNDYIYDWVVKKSGGTVSNGSSGNEKP
jgi:hypothetical protein